MSVASLGTSGTAYVQPQIEYASERSASGNRANSVALWFSIVPPDILIESPYLCKSCLRLHRQGKVSAFNLWRLAADFFLCPH
jgi:hypothetical protein